MTLDVKLKVTNFLKDYLELCLRYSLCITPREPNDLLALNHLTGISSDEDYEFHESEIEELLSSNIIKLQEIASEEQDG